MRFGTIKEIIYLSLITDSAFAGSVFFLSVTVGPRGIATIVDACLKSLLKVEFYLLIVIDRTFSVKV